MQPLRIVTGLAIWLLLAGGGWWWAQSRLLAESSETRQSLAAVWESVAAPRQLPTLKFDRETWLRSGDPIYEPVGDGTYRQIGEIHAVLTSPAAEGESPAGEVQYNRSGWSQNAQAMLYASCPPLTVHSRLTYHEADDSVSWVVATMLPPERRAEIARELSATWQSHQVEIVAALKPVIYESMQQAFAVVEQDLEQALASRREQLAELGARYQEELVQGEVIPLVREHVWPIVRKHAEPAAVEIGQEMWNEVSLWRFSLAFLKDSALGKDGKVKEEWAAFLEHKGLPILERHTDDFVKITRNVLTETSRNPYVRRSVRKNARKVLEDPELRKLVWSIIREVVVDNPRLREVFERAWSSQEAQDAFRLASDRLEPTVHRIGELLFGRRDGEITPEFARVLRRQVLLKDRRWLILEHSPPAGSPASPAAASRSRPAETKDRRPLVLPVRHGGPVPDPPVVVRTR